MSKLTIQPELKFRFDYMRVFQIFWFEQTGLGFSARAELRPGLNPLPCNRQFDFKRICLRSRAEISARVEIRHVIGPLIVISAIYAIEKKNSCSQGQKRRRSFPHFIMCKRDKMAVNLRFPLLQ